MRHDPPRRMWDWRVKPRLRYVPEGAIIHESAVLRADRLDDYDLPLKQPISAYRIEPWQRWGTGI